MIWKLSVALWLAALCGFWGTAQSVESMKVPPTKKSWKTPSTGIPRKRTPRLVNYSSTQQVPGKKPAVSRPNTDQSG